MIPTLLLTALVLGGDPPKTETPRYETRKNHDPNGIGKFYMGREIAHVMSHQGAGWLDRPEREKEEHASKLLPALKIEKGQHIVDLGAGSGYYTLRLAKEVGPEGKVYAVDIQKQMLEIIRKKMKAAELANIDLIYNTPTDPKLPEGKIDLVLMVDVYHELSHPFEFVTELMKSVKSGGKLVFVEFREEDDNVPILAVHKMAEKQVIREMRPHPVRHVSTIGILPWQHIIIFEKK